MAKRKKRFAARHPEEFERLDQELTRALDTLGERNRETERSLDEFCSAGTEACSEDGSPETAERHPPDDTGQ
jgi:hypothetical protein